MANRVQRTTQQPQDDDHGALARRPSVSSDDERGLEIARQAAIHHYSRATDAEKLKIAPLTEQKKRAMTAYQVRKQDAREEKCEVRRQNARLMLKTEKKILRRLRRSFNNATHFQPHDPPTPDELLVRNHKWYPMTKMSLDDVRDEIGDLLAILKEHRDKEKRSR